MKVAVIFPGKSSLASQPHMLQQLLPASGAPQAATAAHPPAEGLIDYVTHDF